MAMSLFHLVKIGEQLSVSLSIAFFVFVIFVKPQSR